MPNSVDNKTIAIGAAAVAAVGLGIYGLVKWRRHVHRFDHLIKADASVKNFTLYQVPGTDYWQPWFYFDRQKEIENLEIYEDDIWVITYIKAGTTWTQEIVWLVCNNADTVTATNVIQDDRFPFLEFPFHDNVRVIKQMPRPRLIKSHLPLGLLPKKFMQVKPKVIYTTRNPKDTLVSTYHFGNLFTMFKEHIPLQKVINQQVKLAGHGGIWDHVQEYWRLRNEPNILILKFEDLKADLPREILKVAKFLDKQLTEEQVMKIAEHCTFKNMQKNPGTNMSWMREQGLWKNQGEFMRKGKVGDWENTFTPEMSAAVDKLTKEWLESEGLTYTYKIK